MYFKLALRNAKRSACNYLLYIATMTILLAIMTISDCIAIAGRVQTGFQTASLPLLIALILTILTGYINAFMLKQRAKELAGYLLLGMEKKKLSLMFIVEFWLIGLFCLGVGTLLSFAVIAIYTVIPTFYKMNHSIAGCVIPHPDLLLHTEADSPLLLRVFLQTFLFFCIIELLSTLPIKRNIDRLQISELMIEQKRHRQPAGRQSVRLWGILFAVSLLCTVCLLLGIAILPDGRSGMMISLVTLPLLLSIFTFYQWFYRLLTSKRQKRTVSLYQRDSLYLIAQITSGARNSAAMSGIFCMCLIFSLMCFVFGILLLSPEFALYDMKSQRWMGVIQICLCIIFIVIYFSILSLQQIMELKQAAKDMRIIHYIGKSQDALNRLIRKWILIRLSVPALFCAAILPIALPLLEYKLNMLMPDALKHILAKCVGLFSVCFAALFICYFLIVYFIGRRFA